MFLTYLSLHFETQLEINSFPTPIEIATLQHYKKIILIDKKFDFPLKMRFRVVVHLDCT